MSNQNFKAAYDNLRKKELIPLRDTIMAATGWSRPTFSNKKLGLRRFEKSEIKIVERVFSKYGLDAWTGEYLKQTA